MAARKFAIRQDDQTRAKIQAGNIIHRLQRAFNGELELSREQISIAKILLSKVLPDLTATEISSEVTVRNVVEMPAPAKSVEDWRSTVPARH
jgi:hypothetical protein